MLLWQTAALALFASPAAHKSRRLVHLLMNFRFQVQAGLELQDGDEIRCVNQRLVFRTLALAQGALVGPFGERVYTLLNWRIDLQIEYATC